MRRPNSIQKSQNLLKKQSSLKNEQNKNKQIEYKNSQNNKIVYQPIITVNGQKKYKQYQKIKIIGKGTYSKCYLVKTVGSQSIYALKIIPKNKLQVLIKQKLVYQIKIQQSLSHPNIVYLDHWFQDHQFQYIFMEYCSQGNLEEKLKQNGKLQQSLIKKYIKEIIQSLIYIHSKHILHRDLKLCNFYIDQYNNIKLGDFGFACLLSNPNQLKRQTCGTPNYIAPQAISGFGYSYTADVWAVGVIFYRLNYGTCPFQGDSVKKTLQNVKLCKYSYPKLSKNIPQLNNLIDKIFNLNYDERISLNQILNHPYLSEKQQNSFTNKVKKQQQDSLKRRFSLTRLFSSSKDKHNKGKQQKQKSPPKGSLKKNDLIPARSNSCQTFKKIKQTFKQKQINTLISSNTLPTQQNSSIYYPTQNNLTMCPSTTFRQNSNKTIRGIIDSMNCSINFLDHTQKDRNSRINQFLKNRTIINQPLNIKLKQKDKQQSKNYLKRQNGKNKIFEQFFSNFQKKYFPPLFYKNQKDIIIISFHFGIKILINIKEVNSQNKVESLVIFKNKYTLYSLHGQKVQFQNLSKVLKYILQKRMNQQNTSIENLQNQDFQIYLHKLPNLILSRKEGIFMKYGTKNKGYFIAKSPSQELQYLASLEESKLNTLFRFDSFKGSFQIQEGPVLSKIYAGWTSNLINSTQIN